RQILSDSTKSGDFDTSSLIKSKITEAEAAGVARQKPKNTVKFNGHEYALIDEKVTWHTAKKRFEEMGGHLACLNTPSESAFLLAICRK
ncbi:hypothetical protein LW982_17945, partial [Erwinia amylovora]|uniref:hypothetical protein n=1 Tax=Erwinia amylovora TaxID=552 RepID=UPI0020BF12D4